MGDSLTPAATSTVRQAIGHGLSYLGICAGGFLAGHFSAYNSLNLTGVTFRFYSAADHGIRKSAVPIAVAGGPPLDHYWEDGPQFSGWGSVVGKYPDGTPAIVEGTYGRGRVILTGVHTEAPENWRRGLRFRTSASVDNQYARRLIRVAFDRATLPHF